MIVRKQLLIVISLIVAIGGAALVIYLIMHPKEHLRPYQYVGANNCVTKVRPAKGMKGYDNQADCQKNEYVNNGWKMVTARGNPKQCISSTTGKTCREGDPGCMCYQNKLCIEANGTETSDTVPLKQPCKIADDDCFLTQYGCWSAQNKNMWKCTARGDGCTYVECDPGDDSCFHDKSECLERCKGYCSEDHGCIQTTDCVKYKDGFVAVDPMTRKPIPGDPCHDNIKECNKKCKSVKCAYKKNSDPKDPLRRKACRWGVCDDGDSDCLSPEWEMDPATGKWAFKPLSQCLNDACAPYACNKLAKTCEIRNGDRSAGDTTGAVCDPKLQPKTCFLGLDECAKNCGGTENSWKCDFNICSQNIGTDAERKKKCANGNCYASYAACKADCASEGQDAYSCYDGCTKQTKCKTIGFAGGLTNGGGGPVCFKTKGACKAACKKMAYTMYDPQSNACVPLEDGRRCDLVENPKMCFPNQVSCQTLHGLPYT